MFATHLELGKVAVLRENKRSVVVQNPEIFLRNNGVEEKVDYIYPSTRKTPEEAEELARNLKDKVDATTIMPYGARQNVVWLHSDDKSAFSRLGEFTTGNFPKRENISMDQILKWRLNFPFPEVEYDGDKKIVFTGEKAPLDELLDETVLSIDIETVDFMPYKISDLRASNDEIRHYFSDIGLMIEGDREQLLDALEIQRNAMVEKNGRNGTLFSVVLASNTGENYLLWQHGNGDHQYKSENGSLDIQLVGVDSVDDLVDKLNEIEDEIDPLIYVGSNLGFDFGFLRDFKYNPAKTGKGPKNRSAKVGFYTPMRIDGAQILDTAAFALHAMPQTPNNSLTTVVNHALGIEASKPDTYDWLATRELELILGFSGAKVDHADYSGQDGGLPLWFTEKFLKPIVLVSEMMRQDPSVISTTSRKENGQKHWEYKNFKQLNTVGGRAYGKAFDDFNLENLTIEMLNKKQSVTQLDLFGGDTIIETGQSFMKNRRGVYDNVRLLHLMPLVKASEPILHSDQYAWKVYQEMHQTENKTVKLMLALYLEAYLENPMWKLKEHGKLGGELMMHPRHNVPNIREFDLSDWIFGQNYGIDEKINGDSANIMTINNNIYFSIFGNTVKQTHVPGLRDHLDKLGMVNYSDHFALVTHPNEETLENTIRGIVDKGWAIDMGSGTALSLTSGRYAAMIDGLITTQGLDIHAKRGYKTLWERDFIPEYIKLVLEGKKEEALELFATANKYISLGLAEDDLVFVSTPGKDLYAYSSLARWQERIKHYEEVNARKGIPVEQRLADIGQYHKQWYGALGTKGRKLSEGPLGDLLLGTFPSINKTTVESIISGRMERLE